MNPRLYSYIENFKDFGLDINAGTIAKITDFATTIKSFGAMISTHNAFDAGSHIATNTGILRDLFNDEWKRYEEAVEHSEGLSIEYGVYAYYPERGELVRYCPEYWHHVVATASSSKSWPRSARIQCWRCMTRSSDAIG